MTALALYTTVFPGVEEYLGQWYRSVRSQTDNGFRLWIGLDELTVEAATSAMGGDPGARWVRGEKGDSPAQIRQRALEQIVQLHDHVVLVDSDDVLHPTRIAQARSALRENDLVGCALRLVDERGEPLCDALPFPSTSECIDPFPRTNVFGLSNSACSTRLLRRCLPIPSSARLVDWFLATRAWLLGARMAFSDEVQMDYRQHGSNMVNVMPPYAPTQIERDTQRVLHHYELLRAAPPEQAIGERVASLERAAMDTRLFYRRVVLERAQLDGYVRALNSSGSQPAWWSWVAHASFRDMWISEEEEK